MDIVALIQLLKIRPSPLLVDRLVGWVDGCVRAYVHVCVKGTCRPFHTLLRWEYSWLITTVAKCNTETDLKKISSVNFSHYIQFSYTPYVSFLFNLCHPRCVNTNIPT